MFKNRLMPITALAFTALAIASASAGCSAVKDAQDAACCKEFEVGADMTKVDFGVDASVKGSFNAYAQATGDLSATASATVADVTASCRNLAVDLGASDADQTAADAKAGTDALSAWCDLAVKQIGANFSATGSASGSLGGSIAVDFTPPMCTASVSATASCEGSCDASAMCDVKANPPTCSGGTLVVECDGDCTASGSADVACTGTCSGTCSGSCKASGGVAVDCQGKCDGTCSAGGSTKGTGAQADGSCDGTCDGTCTLSASAPKLKCTGVCDGHCSAACKGSANFKAQCDGKCSANATPLKCEGGTLKASCMVDAHCEASCNASASAKAQCTPPSVNVTAMASAKLDAAGKLQFTTALDSIKANLPAILIAFQARGQAFLKNAGVAVSAGLEVAGSGKLGAKGAVCAIDIGTTIGTAVDNMTAAVNSATKVAGAVNIKSN